MADALSIGAGIAGVVGLAIQITQILTDYSLEWKDAPADWKMFREELQVLAATLSMTQAHVLQNKDFVAAFEGRSSILLSHLGPNAPSGTDTKTMLRSCEANLRTVLHKLRARANGHRLGWERLKGAFLSAHIRMSVEDLHRQCQTLNNMVAVDTLAVSVATHSEVKSIRKEHQASRREQKDATAASQRWCQESRAQQVLQWLSGVEYGSIQTDMLNRRQEGTGLWLLDSPDFRNWCCTSSTTLYCHGIPGAGKTIITSLVVSHLQLKYEHDPDVAVVYLYCNFRQTEEQKPALLLASLVKQLALHKAALPSRLENLYKACCDKETRPASKAEISSELHAIAYEYSKCFIIVDALDECPDLNGERLEFITDLLRLQSKTGANLFVTSRINPHIARELGKAVTVLEVRAVEQDVRSFLTGQIPRLRHFVQSNVKVQEQIKSKIVQAVDGMFLLAKLHMDSLVAVRSPKVLQQRLESLAKGPNAYDKAYSDAMTRIHGQHPDDCELALQTLSWISRAGRPLTMQEIRHALALEEDQTYLDEANLSESGDILSACAGLVVFDEESQIIRLVHYTTQEYFERTWSMWFPRAEIDLSMTCITYLLFEPFEAGFCQDEEAYEVRLQHYPLFEYAARYWGYHMRAALVDTEPRLMHLLSNSTRVSACAQALLVSSSRFGWHGQSPWENWTGLHLAAYFGLVNTLEPLIHQGLCVDLADSAGRTSLSVSAEHGHAAVAKVLMERDDINSDSRDKNGWTPLSWAAFAGHESLVRMLVDRNDVEADSKNNYGGTPLSLAACQGNVAVAKLLVERDEVEADSKDETYRTPLSIAAFHGYSAIVKLLLERNDVDADSKDIYGRAPLSWAAFQGHDAVVRLLVERDDVVKADLKDNSGWTALSHAAHGGHYSTVKILVDRTDVEADSTDNDCRTPLYRAAEEGHDAVVDLLVNRPDVNTNSVDGNGRTPLSSAAYQGHKAVVQILLSQNDVKADLKDDSGWTPLSLAARQGHEAVVKLLINRKEVEVDSRDMYGRTPLMWAAFHGHEVVVKMLLKRDDVDANSVAKDGRTPFLDAVNQGHVEVVKLLVDQDNAKPDLKDSKSWTPLSRAAYHGHVAVVDLLVSRDDVQADSKDDCGRTPLSKASFQGHEAVVKLLLKRDDVQADSKDNDGRTPLSLAAGRGHEAVVKLLVERTDVDADSKNSNGCTPLLCAAQEGHIGAVRLLVDRDDVLADLKDDDGDTPLHCAAWKGQEAVVRLLADRSDVCVNTRNKNGCGPLFSAASGGHEDVVRLLLERDDVEVNAVNSDGQTPLLIALEKGHEVVVKLLLEKG